jgi:isoaspartyl peptidase/L-asparaginase-like protein (Ntn-hydrolase superfamily)
MATRPVVITSKTNAAVRERILSAAWGLLERGSNALDAALAAVEISERDPRDTTVGYGGDPNEDGVVQLDAAVMFRDEAGAVAALEGIKTPSAIARLVMERTDHLLLVGPGALRFARLHGYHPEDLLSDEARRHWVTWKEQPATSYYRPAPEKPEGGGTIVVLALDSTGEIAGVTSTVGHRFKIPGRVGDTPIIGAGLYTDSAVGAAGATGHGEEAVRTCASFLVVEKMREGMAPREACEYVCKRVIERHGGSPRLNLKLNALRCDGEYGCAGVRGLIGEDGTLTGLGYSVMDDNGFRLLPGSAMLPPLSDDERSILPLR